MSAEEAHRIGLINEVVPLEQLLPRAEAIAERIAANAPIAVQKIKEALRRTSGLSTEEAFKIESECAAVVMQTEDAREGPLSFIEKRQAVFKGR